MNELLKDMSSRIKELREIGGKSTAEMARLTEVDERDYAIPSPVDHILSIFVQMLCK